MRAAQAQLWIPDEPGRASFGEACRAEASQGPEHVTPPGAPLEATAQPQRPPTAPEARGCRPQLPGCFPEAHSWLLDTGSS